MNNKIYLKMKMFAAGLIASAVLLLNLTPAYAGYYTDSASDHKDVSFSEIENAQIYDYATVEASIKRLVEAVEKPGNGAEVEKCYKEMLSQLDNLVTGMALVNLEFYTHLDDEEINLRLEKMSQELIDLGDKGNAAISKMVDGEYRYLVENDIGDGAKDFENYEGMTEEEKALLAREEELETEYERYSQDSGHQGMERYNHLAALYIELVKVRKEIAEHSDYSSYRDYAYKEIYGRDYTIGMADDYHRYVKKYVPEIHDLIVDKILGDVTTYQTMWSKDLGGLDSIFAIMDKHLADIHPDLKESYDYFRKNHVYYIENNDYMFEAGYTTKLYSYNTPFIYLALYGNFYDYSDVFHEFGHFNQMFHNNECAMYSENSYDVAEIHSQAMELFFLQWAEECYGKDLAEMVRLFTAYRMLDNVISGSMQDEFQAEVFKIANDELTVDKLTETYKNVIGGYGYPEEMAYDWVDITHTFNSPFYYISYSTSAMGALQIYELSKSDYDKAVDTYMRLTALPGNVGFCEAMDDVGLKDIMQVGVVRDVCKGLKKSYGFVVEEEVPAPGEDKVDNPGDEPGENQGGIWPTMGLDKNLAGMFGPVLLIAYAIGFLAKILLMVLVGLALIALIVFTVIIIRKIIKRRRDGEQ